MAEARVPVMCIDHGGADVRCVRIQVVPNSEVRGKFKMMALSVQPDWSVDWLVRDKQCTHEHGLRSHTKPHVCACSRSSESLAWDLSIVTLKRRN